MDFSKIKLTIAIPYGRPNQNGVIFTENAVNAAIDSLLRQTPPITLNSDGFRKVIGHANCKEHSIHWDYDTQTCYITVDGRLYSGGIEGVVNELEGNQITDFDIRSFSINLK